MYKDLFCGEVDTNRLGCWDTVVCLRNSLMQTIQILYANPQCIEIKLNIFSGVIGAPREKRGEILKMSIHILNSKIFENSRKKYLGET